MAEKETSPGGILESLGDAFMQIIKPATDALMGVLTAAADRLGEVAGGAIKPLGTFAYNAVDSLTGGSLSGRDEPVALAAADSSGERSVETTDVGRVSERSASPEQILAHSSDRLSGMSPDALASVKNAVQLNSVSPSAAHSTTQSMADGTLVVPAAGGGMVAQSEGKAAAFPQA